MLTESRTTAAPTLKGTALWAEALVLLLVAPFLLFPDVLLPATLLALIAVGILWLRPLFSRTDPPLPTTPVNLALLLWSLALLVSIAVTADPKLTLPKAAGLVLGLSAWRFLVIYQTSWRRLNYGTLFFLVVGLLFTIAGLLGANWLLKEASAVPFLDRLTTSGALQELPLIGLEAGIHPNQLAGAILLYLPLLAALLLVSIKGSTNNWIRWGLFAATAATALSLLLTQSRSGWLGAAAGLVALLLLWLFSRPGQRRVAWLALTGLGLVALTAFFLLDVRQLSQIWLEPPQETALGSLRTLSYRQAVWPWAVAALGDFPYTGTGLGAFRDVVQRLYPIAIPADVDIAHAHNFLLQVGLDLGLPGLVAYVAVILSAAGGAWRAAAGSAELRPLALGLLAGLVAFHAYGLADAVALGSKPGLLLWILVGLLTSLARLRQQDRGSTTAPL